MKAIVIPIILICILISVLAAPIIIDSLSIDHNYKYDAIKVPIYKNETILIEASFCDGKNSTCHAAKYITRKVIDYYDTIFILTKERTSAIVDGVNYEGAVNIKDNKVYRWKVPVGDRNYEEFGYCLKHELEKGVCEIVRK